MSASPSSDASSSSAAPDRVERSAGGVVLRREEPGAHGVHVLLIFDPYGKWGLPKGHLEEGEGPEQTAVREVREETGLSDVELGPSVDAIDWRFRDGDSVVHKHCVFYLMHSSRGAAKPAVEEGIRACRWLRFDAAVERVDYANARGVVRMARRMVREGRHSFDL